MWPYLTSDTEERKAACFFLFSACELLASTVCCSSWLWLSHKYAGLQVWHLNSMLNIFSLAGGVCGMLLRWTKRMVSGEGISRTRWTLKLLSPSIPHPPLGITESNTSYPCCRPLLHSSLWCIGRLQKAPKHLVSWMVSSAPPARLLLRPSTSRRCC